MNSPLRSADNFTSEASGGSLSAEWLVSFKDPRQLMREHPLGLALEVGSALLCVLVFRNARKRGSPEEAFLLVAAACATACFELLPVLPRPGYLLWWHHQGAINFLGGRLPLHVICCFSLLHHLAHRLSAGSGLPPLARSAATSLVGLLLALPAVALSGPLLLLVLHPDDPVFGGRLPGSQVPAVQALVLSMLLFHASHLYAQRLGGMAPVERTSTASLLLCAVGAGAVAAAYAVVEQYLVYLLVALIFRAPSAFTLPSFFIALALIAREEFRGKGPARISLRGPGTPFRRPAWWALVSLVFGLASLPLWLDVAALRSTSERLEIGPCHVRHSVANTSPLEFERRRYICPEDVGSSLLPFDFSCVAPSELSLAALRCASRYTICGRPLPAPERNAALSAACALPLLAALHLLMRLRLSFAPTPRGAGIENASCRSAPAQLRSRRCHVSPPRGHFPMEASTT